MKKKKINVQGVNVRVDENDFICLTDIAKQVDERTDLVLSNWLRNAGTLDFLGEWEAIYNDEFHFLNFETVRKQAGKIGFVMTGKRWTETVGAIGIKTTAGRYGGTYAHKDIAFEFCAAVSARFKLKLIQEFQRLKQEEAKKLNTGWSVRRELTKMNYHLHANAVDKKLIPQELKGKSGSGIFFAKEADLLNTVVFGMTAKEWKRLNPKLQGNQRDHASLDDLVMLANCQALNYCLIKWDSDSEQRFELLNEFVEECRKIYPLSKGIDNLKKVEKKQKKS